MTKLFISNNQVIGIREFVYKFYEIEYDESEKFTHKKLDEFLFSKDIKPLKRLMFQDLKKKDTTSGEYLFIKDEANKIAPYRNPMINICFMCKDLLEVNSQKLKERRENILKQKGYKYDIFGDEVLEDDCVNYHDYNCDYSSNKEDDIDIEAFDLEDNYSNRGQKVKRYGKRGSYRI